MGEEYVSSVLTGLAPGTVTGQSGTSRQEAWRATWDDGGRGVGRLGRPERTLDQLADSIQGRIACLSHLSPIPSTRQLSPAYYPYVYLSSYPVIACTTLCYPDPPAGHDWAFFLAGLATRRDATQPSHARKDSSQPDRQTDTSIARSHLFRSQPPF